MGWCVIVSYKPNSEMYELWRIIFHNYLLKYQSDRAINVSKVCWIRNQRTISVVKFKHALKLIHLTALLSGSGNERLPATMWINQLISKKIPSFIADASDVRIKIPQVMPIHHDLYKQFQLLFPLLYLVHIILNVYICIGRPWY